MLQNVYAEINFITGIALSSYLTTPVNCTNNNLLTSEKVKRRDSNKKQSNYIARVVKTGERNLWMKRGCEKQYIQCV